VAGALGRLDLTGRVALVTGGGSGMGESSALLLAERGARVLIVDRNEDGARRVAAAIGDAAAAFVADVSDPDACMAMVHKAKEEFGHLNIAVNSAGVADGNGTLVADTTLETWRRILSINLDGIFYCMRAQIPALLESGHGSIVNIGSIMSQAGLAHSSAYTASKHGVLGLTRAAALEYGNMDLRVNAIGPGNMDTPMTKRPFSNKEVLDEQLRQQAMTRLGEAWEVAEMVAFLASDAASFCTGAWMGVDGGYTAR
jgi:NAD(P)-dependent dehydrogenase (short-subunit alcohol dehydrogenase family)